MLSLVRRLMEQINAKASLTAAAGNSVSPEGLVSSLRSDGRGMIQLSGPGLSSSPVIMQGTDLGKVLKNVLTSLGADPASVHLVQGGYASSGTGMHQPSEVLHACTFRVSVRSE